VNKEFKQFSFLIDVESHPKSKEFLKAMNVIKKIAYRIKILGFYEASTFRK
jgi:prephenate dehydratase